MRTVPVGPMRVAASMAMALLSTLVGSSAASADSSGLAPPVVSQLTGPVVVSAYPISHGQREVVWSAGVGFELGTSPPPRVSDVTYTLRSNRFTSGRRVNGRFTVVPRGTTWVQVVEHAKLTFASGPAVQATASSLRMRVMPAPGPDAVSSPSDTYRWAGRAGASPLAELTQVATSWASAMCGVANQESASPFATNYPYGAAAPDPTTATAMVVSEMRLEGKGWHYGVGVASSSSGVQTCVVVFFSR